MDAEHIRLLAKESAREAMIESQQALEARIAHGVALGISAHFREMGITGDHMLWVRRRYEDERSTWGIVRRVTIATVLAAALVFGGRAVWEAAMAKVVSAADRAGAPHAEPRTSP